MSAAGVEAVRADREVLLGLAAGFSAEEWAAPSDCVGWRVQDVVAHMATVFRSVVDASSLPAADLDDTERAMETWVAERKSWSPARVLEEYEEIGAQGLEVLASLQAAEMAEVVLPLGDLGTHPVSRMADALAFDHYTHIRVDLLAPTGPLQREAPPADELRLGPSIAWMVAGLPQMNADLLDRLGGRVALELDGPGAASLAVGDDGPVGATVRSCTADFVIWGTQRRGWRSFPVAVEGDRALAERFLDGVRVF